MANKSGPSPGEFIFRAALSTFGLILLAVAITLHGIPKRPAFVEILGFGGVLLGGSLLHALWKLIRKDYPKVAPEP